MFILSQIPMEGALGCCELLTGLPRPFHLYCKTL